MRKLWIITATMVVCGTVLVLGSAVGGLGPIPLIGGVLLIWSGIIKVVVLRVWDTTLSSPPMPEPARAGSRLAPMPRESS